MNNPLAASVLYLARQKGPQLVKSLSPWRWLNLEQEAAGPELWRRCLVLMKNTCMGLSIQRCAALSAAGVGMQRPAASCNERSVSIIHPSLVPRSLATWPTSLYVSSTWSLETGTRWQHPQFQHIPLQIQRCGDMKWVSCVISELAALDIQRCCD